MTHLITGLILLGAFCWARSAWRKRGGQIPPAAAAAARHMGVHAISGFGFALGATIFAIVAAVLFGGHH